MNQFKMSLFLPPISPVKDSATGRTVQPPTLTPYKEITLQEVYKLITSSERLKTLTETVRRAAENGDEKSLSYAQAADTALRYPPAVSFPTAKATA